MEVFKFDGTKECYSRPIPDNVNSVWAFKSLLEIAKEVTYKMIIKHTLPVLFHIGKLKKFP